MTKRNPSDPYPVYALASDVGPNPDDYEPATVIVVTHEVRREVLSDEARQHLRQQARDIALEVMTEAEWEAARIASGDPVRADAHMVADGHVLRKPH